MIFFGGIKLLRLVLTTLAVTAITYLMVALLPGDAALTISGPGTTIEDVQAVREELGLNRNVFLGYVKWLINTAHGRLGNSFRSGESVSGLILERLPVTLELMIVSQLFALFLALPLGVISAYKSGTRLDKTINTAAFGLMSVPVFVMAVVCIYFFSLKLNVLPATGFTPWSEGIFSNLKSFILPGLSIAVVESVPLMRVLRSDMISTLQEDYVLMARSKGLSSRQVLIKHALRPSCFTFITLFGIQVGHLIGGAVLVETIFALPGIGSLLVDAIYGRDYPVVQGCILFITIAYILINFAIDILYTVFDPRIRPNNAAGENYG
jgi:peptide/nickel transport system permease protein